MIIVYNSNNTSFKVDVIKFSDGAMNVVVPQIEPKSISIVIENVVTDLHCLDLTINAYKHMNFSIDTLVMLYIPNARADRVFEKGNALPIEVIADSINKHNFKMVLVDDPHSSVSTDLINNTIVADQTNCMERTFYRDQLEGFVFVAPDKGAFEKTASAAIYFSNEMIVANKTRDITTGKIVSTELGSHDDLTGKDCLIVDDICDGGGTFIPLAIKLKEAGAKSVSLYVTHGIFSKGLDVFKGTIDKIYVCNIVCNYVNVYDIMSYNKE